MNSLDDDFFNDSDKNLDENLELEKELELEKYINSDEIDININDSNNKLEIDKFLNENTDDYKNKLLDNELIKEIETKILNLFSDDIIINNQEVDLEILEIALPEIIENIQEIKNIINNSSCDFELLKRALHTLKGSLNMAGLTIAGLISHRVESILDICQAYNISVEEIYNIINYEFDKIEYIVNNNKNDFTNQLWLNNIFSVENESKDIELNNVNSENSENNVTSVSEENMFAHLYDEKIELYEDEIDLEILEIALPEIQEHQTEIYNIVELYKNSNKINSNEFKRVLHTLKGSLRMSGLNKAGFISHRVESILDSFEHYNLNIDNIFPLLEFEIEKINFLIENKEKVLNIKQLNWLNSDFKNVDKNLETKKNNINKESNVEDNISKSETGHELKINDVLEYRDIKEEKVVDKFLRVKASLIDSLVNDAGELRRTKAALTEIFLLNKKGSGELKSAANKLQQILKELVIAAETQIQSQKQQYNQFEEGFDPLEFDRFTRLQELTRFISEIAQDISDTVDVQESQSKNQYDIFNQQSIITNNLLNELIKVRLVNVNSIVSKLYKIVKTSAKDLNKIVSLDIEGESTEVDRVVLDKIFDPIAHILRNSVAHGIEKQEDRIKNKKSIIGKIKLSARLEGNYIILSINDDGSGINTEKIKESAIKKGIIDPNSSLTENELINLIFMPGFSTASTVSQVAGRGVGMDVVLTEVRALGGTIKVETKINEGTKFILSIPVSVATTAAMLFYSSNNLISLPAMLIDNIASVKKDKLLMAYETGIINYENANLPFYYCGHLLGGPLPHHQKPEIKSHNSVVIIEHEHKKIAMHVDSISGTNDILIKGVNAHMSKIPGILGTTELGDGTQSLIINPIMLINYWSSIGKTPSWCINKNKYEKEEFIENTQKFDEKQIITVMVVDDSVTVRKTSEKVLLNNGFEVILAKHGENALEILQTRTPDIILSDIEMPVMDGFDFVKNVRANENYKNIPIIMITSRTAEKHQNYAFSLGANDFMGKPFNEKDLLKSIKALLKNFKI